MNSLIQSQQQQEYIEPGASMNPQNHPIGLTQIPLPNIYTPDRPKVHAAFCSYCIETTKGPIVGKRYSCVICINFDLCEKCESIDRHWHPMLRFSEPTPNKNIEQAKKILISTDPYLYSLKREYLQGYHNTQEETQSNLEEQLNKLSYH